MLTPPTAKKSNAGHKPLNSVLKFKMLIFAAGRHRQARRYHSHSTQKNVATGSLRLRVILQAKSHLALLPRAQTLQAHRKALRTNTESIQVHAIKRQRAYLDTVNVNALRQESRSGVAFWHRLKCIVGLPVLIR
jgi:hypothetical protein